MIVRNIAVPTGDICIMKGQRGLLEFLSIGDYGKDKNVKADFIGLTREIEGVPNGDIMPLSEKWVITISSQYGCSMGYQFCDVPMVGRGINATIKDLNDQVLDAINLHPEVSYTNRLNVHYARMGEPTFNPVVLQHARSLPSLVREKLGGSLIHPVVSTMMPRRNKKLFSFLSSWCDIKNRAYGGDAGLQLSINSTDDKQRLAMFNGKALNLDELAFIGSMLPMPVGRKYALNFALADNYVVDEKRLATLFNTRKFMVKITPLHKTKSCEENGIVTTGGYTEYTPYKDVETRLKRVGFDVIVFIPSYDEDMGMITCGNAILSGRMPQTAYTEVR